MDSEPSGAPNNAFSASMQLPDHATRWRSSLYIAADHGDKEVVQLLLKKGADPKRAITKVPIEDGRSALHAAAHGGHTQIIKLLLSAGADPNQRDNLGRTALESIRQQERSSSIQMQEALTAAGDSMGLVQSVRMKNRRKLESMYAEWRIQRPAIIRLLEQAERRKQA
jgi:tRNA pseudouridine-54 N-methylase